MLPISMLRAEMDCQEDDVGFRNERLELRRIPLGAAFGVLVRASLRPARIIPALRFVRAQTGLTARSLLLASARIAAAATRGGCTHLHAHFAHGTAAHAIVAARLGGFTCSFTGHGGDVNVAPVDLPLKIVSADRAIAVSGDMAAKFRRMANEAGGNGSNVRVVFCGVNPSRFRPDARPSNGRLLSVGRLMPVKGYHVLLAALAALPPARRPAVDVVGTGPLAAELVALAEQMGVAGSVSFLGAKPAGWIAANGPSCIGFVAPYIIAPNGDCDTGPLAVKEAMAMQLPVVTSALMSIKEMVTPACGRLVTIGDANELAEALSWLAAIDLDTRRRMGEAGRQRVLDHFTLEGQAIGLAAVIRSCRT